MTKILALLLCLHAQAETNLDDFISPDEILQEIEESESYPELNEALDFFEPLSAALSPQRNLSLEESSEIYGVNWLKLYPLVLVINTAQKGPTAQRMIVYKNGRRAGVYVISTGREKSEIAKSGKRYFSRTPVGWFVPTRLVKNHYSATWQAPMDFSIFFIGGIATHAAVKASEKDLGKRASGGCVRLLKSQAQDLFNTTRNNGLGNVPRFDRSGRPIFKKNSKNLDYSKQYQTLIYVTNQPGR
jgi:hypothetical protein